MTRRLYPSTSLLIMTRHLGCIEYNELNCYLSLAELDKLHVWLSVNKLSLNVDKTNFILFGNRKNIDNVCITMNNSIITRVRATKFLGVIIDEKLTWKDHISLVRSKLSKTVGILYRIRHLLNRSALFILYCSLFLPYLTYCAEIWGNTYKSNTQCIFLLQKKIVRTFMVHILEITPMLFFRI